mmetsp:Transcript_5596/g.23027  ORF Transcript_5596/g.23027 Transcript_5596/m.23027 type:complete len:254 (+) Transcript_5596:2253-3014(+)
MDARMSPTISTSEVLDSSGLRNCNTLDTTSTKLRSAFSVSSTSGFSTLTTTSLFPALSTALCTCATDADATGSASNDAKTSSMERTPRSFSTVRLMTAKSVGSVASRHFWNSATYSAGNTEGADATNCPIFTYVAPRDSKVWRRSFGGEMPRSGALRSRLCALRIASLARDCAALMVRGTAAGPAPRAISVISRTSFCASGRRRMASSGSKFCAPPGPPLGIDLDCAAETTRFTPVRTCRRGWGVGSPLAKKA